MTQADALGFIGTGVMGEPMCRNLAAKSGRRVAAWDPSPAPLERLRAQGVQVAASAADLAQRSQVLFLCLPGGAQLESLCESALLPAARKGLTVVDLGTSGVGRTKALAAKFAARALANPTPGRCCDHATSPRRDHARPSLAAEDGSLRSLAPPQSRSSRSRFSFTWAHSSASEGAGFFSMIGGQSLARSALI